MQELSDETLATRLKDGDHEAFAELLSRYAAQLYNFAGRRLTNSADAQDLVQEVFLKIWYRPELWDENHGSHFRSWLYKVALNACRDHLRKRQLVAHESLTENSWTTNKTAESTLLTREAGRRVEAAIRRLPARQQEALILCFYSNFRNKEAAQIMGLNLKALESLLMRAKESLRRELRGHSHDDA